MENSIIIMQENLHMGERISGLFSSLTVAINSVQWKSALNKFKGKSATPSADCLRVSKGNNYVELIRKPIIGTINFHGKDIAKIYELEIIDDLSNPFKTITSKYFVRSEDAFLDPAWDIWKDRITRYKYEFKSLYCGHYIDIKQNKSIRVKPIFIRNNIFDDFYEDID